MFALTMLGITKNESVSAMPVVVVRLALEQPS